MEVIMRGSLIITAAALAMSGLGPAVSSAASHASAFLDALFSKQPNKALTSKLNLYGRFVGSWDLDIDYYPPDGSVKRAKSEWHFSWVLNGRAVQDVFIFPSRAARAGKPDEPWWQYGSTFRWFDPAIDAWHITYFEPTRAFATRQIGRAVGPDIEQMSDEIDGVIRRWRFVEITEQSFRWIGEASRDKGASWALEMEMRARRAV
jgi:hypothetical protein